MGLVCVLNCGNGVCIELWDCCVCYIVGMGCVY